MPATTSGSTSAADTTAADSTVYSTRKSQIYPSARPVHCGQRQATRPRACSHFGALRSEGGRGGRANVGGARKLQAESLRREVTGRGEPPLHRHRCPRHTSGHASPRGRRGHPALATAPQAPLRHTTTRHHVWPPHCRHNCRGSRVVEGGGQCAGFRQLREDTDRIHTAGEVGQRAGEAIDLRMAGDDATMKECAETCRKCAESCTAMAGAGTR